MRALNQTPNIGAANAAFPDGVIVDEAGGVTGTALTEILYGDLVQLIHKLRRLAPITPNNLPDNETNGFQLLDAMNRMFIPRWTASGQGVDFANVKFVQYGQGIYYHKTAVNTTNSPNLDTTNWTLVCQWDGLKMVFNITPIYTDMALAPGVTIVDDGGGNSGWAYFVQEGKHCQIDFRLYVPTGLGTIATLPAGFNIPTNAKMIPRNTGEILLSFAGIGTLTGEAIGFRLDIKPGSETRLRAFPALSTGAYVQGSISWYGA